MRGGSACGGEAGGPGSPRELEELEELEEVEAAGQEPQVMLMRRDLMRRQEEPRSAVPEIANPRNHRGEEPTPMQTHEGLLLELGPKCTPHGGAGTRTPRLRGGAAL